MSIDAKELRLGNKVKVKISNDAAFYEIVSINYASVKLDGVRSGEVIIHEKLKPIPITPEILLSCGFTKAPETDPYGFYLSPEFQDCKIRIRKDEFGWHWQYGSATIRLPHLHQLQNLYYCLTGSELEINL